jgi:CHAT domain-containing protein
MRSNLFKQRILYILLFFLNINPSNAQIIPFLEQSIDFFNQEKYYHAISCLRNISSLDSLDSQDKIDYHLCFGFSYVGLGNFKDAESSILNALQVLQNDNERKDSLYIDMLSLVGWFYFNIGEFAEAKYYYEDAFSFAKNASIIYDDEALILDNLATCHFVLGNTEQTRLLYEEAWFKHKYVWSYSHPHYSTFLNHVTLFSKLIKDDKLYLECLSAKIDLYASIRENMRNSSITAYLHIRSYDSYFDKDFLSKIQYQQKQRNDNPIKFQSIEDDFAEFIYNLTHPITKVLLNLNSEEHLYNKMDVSPGDGWKNFARKEFYRYSKYSDAFSLAELAYLSGDINKSEEYILEANFFYANLMKKNLYFLDENAREIFWYTLEPIYNLFYSTSIKNKSSSLSELCYNNSLKLKSILLNSNIEIRQAILSSGDSILIDYYNEYIELSQNLQRLMTLDASMSFTISENKKKELETYLSQSSLKYINNGEDEFTWIDIKNKLKDNEYAIEFICFNHYQTNDNHYLALIIGKNYDYPILVDLFSERKLGKILDNTGNTRTIINKIYSSQELYNLLWKPLELYLEDKDRIKVYFSASGKLNQIAFHAIPVSKRVLLGNKYDLHQLSSTRQIVNDKLDEYRIYESIAIWGDIDYGEKLSPRKSDTDESSQITNYLLSKPKLKKWERLNDEKEVNSVYNQCLEKDISVTKYTSINATKYSFGALNGKSPDIVYASTHGFYYPLDSVEKDKYRQLLPSFSNEISLLCSGLIFAGINNNFSDKYELNDGVLFAQEIANMNLSGTDLVVLSACQTGLGEIRNNEGVFGLQRAFKLAGANTLLISLWDVPVEYTGRFISQFYRELLSDKHPSKQKAFRAAQLYMQQSDDLSIYDWAGFILID